MVHDVTIIGSLCRRYFIARILGGSEPFGNGAEDSCNCYWSLPPPSSPQPRKASATCSSATAAASSGLEEWTSRSPRQRSSASSPEHPELHAELGIKPPSPGTVLALAKPPSPCAPGQWLADREHAGVRKFCLGPEPCLWLSVCPRYKQPVLDRGRPGYFPPRVPLPCSGVPGPHSADVPLCLW